MFTILQKSLNHLFTKSFYTEFSLKDWVSYKQQIKGGKLSFARLLEIIQSNLEYEQVLKPVLAEIQEVYYKFLFREASPKEILEHIQHFYEQLDTSKARQSAIRNGNIRIYLGIRPFKLEMDIVNQCNLRCIMCHFSSPELFQRKKAELSLEDFASIAEQLFPLCSQVSLSISTEPLLHTKLEELLKITGKYKIPFVFMYSNGQLLNDRIINQLIESKLNHISISIDAATKQTYEKIRVGAKFERLIANIEAINLAKERSGSATPHLCFNFVMMRSNISELPAVVELARNLKVETVAAVQMIPLAIATADPKEESLIYHKSLSNQMLAQARQLAQKYHIHVTFPEPFEEEVSDPSPLNQSPSNHQALNFLPPSEQKINQPCCSFPWHFIGLDSEGNVIPCGWWYNQLPMGNLLKEPFESIWNNKEYRKLREELSIGKLRQVCQTCPAAGMGNMNSSNAFAER